MDHLAPIENSRFFADPYDMCSVLMEKLATHVQFAELETIVVLEKYGHFTLELEKIALEQDGITIEELKAKTTILSINTVTTAHLKRSGWTVIRTAFEEDYINWLHEQDVKPDLFIANPPYQNEMREGGPGNNSSWSRLLTTLLKSKGGKEDDPCLGKDGYLVWVSPSSWRTPKREKGGVANHCISQYISRLQ